MKYLDYLRGQVGAFFEAKGYREACRKRYRHTWDHLKAFMLAREIKAYTPDVGFEFLSEWHDGKEYNALSPSPARALPTYQRVVGSCKPLAYQEMCPTQ